MNEINYEKYEGIIVNGWSLIEILELGGQIITDISGDKSEEYIMYIDTGSVVVSKIPQKEGEE